MRRGTIVTLTALALALTAAAALAEDATNRGLGPQSTAPQMQSPGAPDAGPGMGGPGMHRPGRMGMQGMQGMGPGGAAWRRGAGAWRAQRMHAGMGPRIAQALGLSDEQKHRIADIRDAMMKKNAQTRADLVSARIDLRRLMRADTPDRQALDSQIDRIAELRAAMLKTRLAGHLQMRDVLTPEQQKKLRDLHPGMPGAGRRMGLEDEEDGPEGDAGI